MGEPDIDTERERGKEREGRSESNVDEEIEECKKGSENWGNQTEMRKRKRKKIVVNG